MSVRNNRRDVFAEAANDADCGVFGRSETKPVRPMHPSATLCFQTSKSAMDPDADADCAIGLFSFAIHRFQY
jgi:hypothetical protein